MVCGYLAADGSRITDDSAELYFTPGLKKLGSFDLSSKTFPK
jgi:hypothetical protein